MKEKEVFEYYQRYVMNTYSRFPVVFVKGKGSRLWDIHHKEYIDLFPGWAVSVLGHCPSSVMSAVRYQIGRLIHLPNNFYHIGQAKLAKEIVYRMGMPAKVFFCNSGAEAVEGALKLSRIWGKEDNKFEVITMQNSFHGRTLGALTLTGQDVYQKGFDPLVPGVKRVEFNAIEQVKKAISDRTCAIILELIQGEGGVNVADVAYIKALRQLCDEKKILLIFDEVQTGIGRTGKWFCFQHYGVVPDIVTLAKGLGGGLPVGAVVAREEVANCFEPGMHASTFGGNPVVCKAALAVFKTIQKEKLLSRVNKISKEIFDRLLEWKAHWPDKILDVRGKGFMIGVELSQPGHDIVRKAFERGVLINCTHKNILRIMPALNIERKLLKQGLDVLEGVFKDAFSNT